MRNIFQSILAISIGIIAVVFFVEVSARILSNVLGLSPYMKYDEHLGWTAEPRSTKHHKNSHLEFDVIYQINNQGFRGPAYEKAKPAGIYRIMILGDSNGFGWGIPEDKHFATLLQGQLKNVQVLNLSLSGYGTDQQYLRFVKEGMAYKPDLVIVQVTPNDFDEIQYPFFNQKPKPQFLITDKGALKLVNVPVEPIGPRYKVFYDNSLPLPFKEWLGWHSYAYTFINEKYYLLKSKYTRRNNFVEPDRKRFSNESVTLFKKIISELKSRLDEIGAKGLIVHSSKDLNENNYLANSSLPILDLYPKFSGYARTASAELFYKDGFHWNIEGHRIVADELLKVINRKGRIGGPE